MQHCVQVLNTGEGGQDVRPLVYLSGGETPKVLYEKLSAMKIDFDEIDWAMVDERWVAPTHPRSNQQFIEKCFSNAEGFHLRALKNGYSTPALGLPKAERCYQALSSRATLCVLGMGGDGHFASLFPHSDGLSAALALSNKKKLAVIEAISSAVTGAETARITLTLKTILNSQQVLLLLKGEKKYQCFKQAWQQDDTQKTPISALLNQQQTDVHVYWCP